MVDYFDADMGEIWVQPGGYGTRVWPVLCTDSDGLDSPGAETTTRMCRKGKTWSVSSRSTGVPGEASASLESYLGKTMSWLQLQWKRQCFFPVYFLSGECLDGEFDDYEYGTLGRQAWITGRTPAARVRQKEEAGAGAADPSMLTFELTTEPMPPEFWKMFETMRQTTDAEAEPARDISVDMRQICANGCGNLQDPCTDGGICCDDAGPGAEGHETTDGFATTAVWATNPFAAAEDITSRVEFQLDRNTHRILVACGTAAVAGLRVSYSDDAGATWTPVALNAIATEFVGHGGGLFALDRDHIWLGERSVGKIFFSSDGGLTWTDQGAPAAAALEGIMCIDFVNANYGWAVGGHTTPSAHMLTTIDGGVHWLQVTAEPAAKFMTGVSVLDSVNVRVVTTDGFAYITRDWGATWTDQSPSPAPDSLGDCDHIDQFAAVMCGYRTVSAVIYGAIYRTINGGWTWEEHLTNTAFDGAIEYHGLNSIVQCDYNHAIAAGEILGAKPLIFVVVATQPA